MVVKAAGALAWINAVAPSYTSSHCIKTLTLLNTGPWVGIMYFCCTPKCHGFLKKRFLWNLSVNGLSSFSYRISFLLKNWQSMIIHFWVFDRNFLKNKVSPLFQGKQLWQHLLPVTKSAPSFHLSTFLWWDGGDTKECDFLVLHSKKWEHWDLQNSRNHYFPNDQYLHI